MCEDLGLGGCNAVWSNPVCCIAGDHAGVQDMKDVDHTVPDTLRRNPVNHVLATRELPASGIVEA
jgi:hypothetical protein